jgi:hypothetical protein
VGFRKKLWAQSLVRDLLLIEASCYGFIYIQSLVGVLDDALAYGSQGEDRVGTSRG